MIAAPCLVRRDAAGVPFSVEKLVAVPVVGLTIWNVRVRDNRPRGRA